MDPNDPTGNNQLALDVAEQELGISPVLSSTEMASLSDDEQLGLITYLSQFYDAFRTAPGRMPPKNPVLSAANEYLA